MIDIKNNIKKFANSDIKKRLECQFPEIEFLNEKAYGRCIECNKNARAVGRLYDKEGKAHRVYFCGNCGLVYFRDKFQALLYKRKLFWKTVETHNLHKIRGKKRGIKR